MDSGENAVRHRLAIVARAHEHSLIAEENAALFPAPVREPTREAQHKRAGLKPSPKRSADDIGVGGVCITAIGT